MKNRIPDWYNPLSRFEKILLASVLGMFLILVPLLILFACNGDTLIKSVYEHHSPGILSRLIPMDDSYPPEHYLALKKEMALRLFIVWSFCCLLAVPALVIVYRFFFSQRSINIFLLIFPCCLFLALLFYYNDELRTTSTHTFFYAGPVYQIINGNIPPWDPLFGGEVLHYQWGHPLAAALVSKLLNVTPFSSFAVLNIVSLAGCLWLLYKIANLLTDNPKVSVFCAFVTVYCGSFLYMDAAHLKRMLPFYAGESRIFPLLTKFVNNNGAPLGLVFVLLMIYGTLKLFENRKTLVYSLFVLLGATGTLFFYSAFGPGMLAWFGFIGLLWLSKYKQADFIPFGKRLLLLCILMAISLGAVSPYLKQISSSGGFLQVDFFNPRFILENMSNLIPMSVTCVFIILFRKYIMTSLNRQNLSLLACFFLANMCCYLFSRIPSSVEYKFLLLALIPFGISGAIAFSRVRYYSSWAALALFVFMSMNSVKLCRYQFASSPQTIFDVDYTAPYRENGIALESSDPEENELYRWILDKTSINNYFLDIETKIPIYAQRSLWVAFDNHKSLPGYGMSVFRMQQLHGYDEQDFNRRQQIAQNLYGTQSNLTDEEVAMYLADNRLFVIARHDNIRIPLVRYGFEEVFTSKTGQFRILAKPPL